MISEGFLFSYVLKAYGGDEGWTFIEEASYRILIDAILEGLGENSQENIEQKASIESNSSQKVIIYISPQNEVLF